MAGHAKAYITGPEAKAWEAALRKYGADDLGKIYAIAVKRMKPGHRHVYWSAMVEVIETCVREVEE
jgi:hypothetical protein